MQNRSFHARHKLNHTRFTNVLDEPVDDRVAQFAMCHLTAAEPQAGLYLVAFSQKADGLILLRLVVVLVNRDGEFYFLHNNHFLLFARCSLALFLLVQKASIVVDAADGWDRIGRNLNQVQSTLSCNLQSLKRGENAELFAVFIDDADFAGANPVVNADKRFCRTFVECDGTPPDVIAAAFGAFPELDAATATHPEYSIGPARLCIAELPISRP